MKNKFLITAATACLMAAPSFGETTFKTGLTDLIVSDAKRPLEGFIWYPTSDRSAPKTFHTNAVWEGIEAIESAQPSEGKFPLIVLSHGMFGNAMNQSWLASELAQNGYIVAAISHPGTSTWLRDPDDRRELWERPKDISRIIDHFADDAEWAERVDQNQIFMAGHSLGGFTAMLLAGARYDAEKIDGFCSENPREMVCGIFGEWQIAKSPEDRLQMTSDLSDDRIKGFGIFDLGGTQSFDLQSLADIDRPLLIFGAPNTNSGLDLDIESRALRDALPSQVYTYHEPKNFAHFDFLGNCKSGAIEILKAEEPGDEIICEGGGVERSEKHDFIVKTFDDFINKN